MSLSRHPSHQSLQSSVTGVSATPVSSNNCTVWSLWCKTPTQSSAEDWDSAGQLPDETQIDSRNGRSLREVDIQEWLNQQQRDLSPSQLDSNTQPKSVTDSIRAKIELEQAKRKKYEDLYNLQRSMMENMNQKKESPALIASDSESESVISRWWSSLFAKAAVAELDVPINDSEYSEYHFGDFYSTLTEESSQMHLLDRFEKLLATEGLSCYLVEYFPVNISNTTSPKASAHRLLPCTVHYHKSSSCITISLTHSVESNITARETQTGFWKIPLYRANLQAILAGPGPSCPSPLPSTSSKFSLDFQYALHFLIKLIESKDRLIFSRRKISSTSEIDSDCFDNMDVTLVFRLPSERNSSLNQLSKWMNRLAFYSPGSAFPPITREPNSLIDSSQSFSDESKLKENNSESKLSFSRYLDPLLSSPASVEHSNSNIDTNSTTTSSPTTLLTSHSDSFILSRSKPLKMAAPYAHSVTSNSSNSSASTPVGNNKNIVKRNRTLPQLLALIPCFSEPSMSLGQRLSPWIHKSNNLNQNARKYLLFSLTSQGVIEIFGFPNNKWDDSLWRGYSSSIGSSWDSDILVEKGFFLETKFDVDSIVNMTSSIKDSNGPFLIKFNLVDRKLKLSTFNESLLEDIISSVETYQHDQMKKKNSRKR